MQKTAFPAPPQPVFMSRTGSEAVGESLEMRPLGRPVSAFSPVKAEEVSRYQGIESATMTSNLVEASSVGLHDIGEDNMLKIFSYLTAQEIGRMLGVDKTSHQTGKKVLFEIGKKAQLPMVIGADGALSSFSIGDFANQLHTLVSDLSELQAIAKTDQEVSQNRYSALVQSLNCCLTSFRDCGIFCSGMRCFLLCIPPCWPVACCLYLCPCDVLASVEDVKDPSKMSATFIPAGADGQPIPKYSSRLINALEREGKTLEEVAVSFMQYGADGKAVVKTLGYDLSSLSRRSRPLVNVANYQGSLVSTIQFLKEILAEKEPELERLKGLSCDVFESKRAAKTNQFSVLEEKR